MKEEYIRMRKSGFYRANWFYRYYLSKGGTNVPFEYFVMVFQTGDIDNIIDYIDKEYKLTEAYNYNKTWQ